MKILIINANTSDVMTQGIDTVAKKYARPDTEIVTTCSREGPRSLETKYEYELVASSILEKVIEGNRKNFDAIIPACYGDPGLIAAKEISDVPVYGIAETSMHMACMLGPAQSGKHHQAVGPGIQVRLHQGDETLGPGTAEGSEPHGKDLDRSRPTGCSGRWGRGALSWMHGYGRA